MHRTFLFGYDLNKVKDYPALYALFEKWGAIKLQESVRLVRLAGSATYLRNALGVYVDLDDEFFLIEIRPGADWATYNAPVEAEDFLKVFVNALPSEHAGWPRAQPNAESVPATPSKLVLRLVAQQLENEHGTC